MESVYKAQEIEQRIYDLWEKKGHFKPVSKKGAKPFTIILPPPNANADLHLGHAMYVIEDIMIRYHRMKGDRALWVPGADHAGFETQYVFEKFLSKQGKSRFDYGRDELYAMIWDFVQKNRGVMENQLRRLGFSLDWSRTVFTLDPKVVAIAYKTFKRLYDEGLIYRGAGLVNYCTKCGTGFSDLEVTHTEQNDPLYYMKYGPFVVATGRPETMFGDVAVAVNPRDKRYKEWVGKEIEVTTPINTLRLRVVADDLVDPKFGTGAVKVTPAHDMNDFEIARRHNLPLVQIIGFNGRLNEKTGKYQGMKIKAARAAVIADLSAMGLMEKIDESYRHVVGSCYKCGTYIEPLPLPQWYIKVAPLVDEAKKAIKTKKVSFVTKRFEKRALQILNEFHDWNISRQIVWGIRIPAWKCIDCKDETRGWVITDGAVPSSCPDCHGTNLKQDSDTFDTWFSSGQWPFATLLTDKAHLDKDGHFVDEKNSDYYSFYPTSVMETGHDILSKWVCRMIMLGLYMTDKPPFEHVYLHGLVRDGKGQKMSKSKGNVINPLKVIEQYGADALRMALVFGTTAGNDMSISDEKIRGMRNFVNKLWNMGRFLDMHIVSFQEEGKIDDFRILPRDLSGDDALIYKKKVALQKKVAQQFEKYRFGQASEALYDFVWHEMADKYLESIKDRLKAHDKVALAVFIDVYRSCLLMLHPFIPFATEELYQKLPKEVRGENLLIVSEWPK